MGARKFQGKKKKKKKKEKKKRKREDFVLGSSHGCGIIFSFFNVRGDAGRHLLVKASYNGDPS